MAFETDYIIDRRRLKRRLVFWRITAIVIAIAAIVGAGSYFDHGFGKMSGERIARLRVEGIILSDQERAEALKDVAEDSSIKALVVAIDSPGGTFVGSDQLYQSLLEVAENKPVVAVMGNAAASGGYMTALAADHIIAHSGSITGSIGVIMQMTNLTEMLEKIGIKPEVVKSGPMKAQPNPFENFTPEAREVTQSVINDLYGLFVEMVAERRQMSIAMATSLADGRIYSGRQALNAKLVDALGDEKIARVWLEKTHKISASLPVEDVTIEYEEDDWQKILGSTLSGILFSKKPKFGGVMALWQPNL